MKNKTSFFYSIFLSILILASALSIPSQASAQTQDEKRPVIVLFNHPVSEKQKSLITSLGGDITHTYTIINGLSTSLTQNAIDALKKNPSVLTIDPDLEVHALETHANDKIGATTVHDPPILKTGNGIRVAILDTGITLNHPEFVGKNIICKSVFSTSPTACIDGHGHGTHVAGIVGGIGSNTAALGVAPDVDFYIYKVLDDSGSGSFSGIIQAIDDVVADGNARVISMSLGADVHMYYNKNSSNCDGVLPTVTQAIKNAKDAGVTVVSAAGNSGNTGVSLPGCISYTIAVGATNNIDNIASFSSTGGPMMDHGISAPGVSIFSSVPSTGASCCSDPSLYMDLSGTSMATPMVSGSIALLLEQDSSLTPDNIKNILFSTACNEKSSYLCPTGTTPNTSYGYGRIDILSAINSITQNDPLPLPDLSINDVTMAEGESGTSNMVFTVTRSGDSTGSISIDYATADNTANAGSDYVSTSNTLTFGDGITMQQILVPVNGDTVVEPDETFFVNLSNCTGCTISDSQGIGTITNDDSQVVVQIDFAQYNAKQDTLRIRASSSDPTQTLSVYTNNVSDPNDSNWQYQGDLRNKGDGTYDGRISNVSINPPYYVKVVATPSSSFQVVSLG